MYTRREFGLLTLAGLVRLKKGATAIGAGADALVNGVRIGVQTYSFRDLPRTLGGDGIDPVIKAMTDCGLAECELFAAQAEPQFDTGAGGSRGSRPPGEAQKAREDLRKWRVET